MKTEANLGSQKARTVGKGRVWLSCVVYPGRQEEKWGSGKHGCKKNLPSCLGWRRGFGDLDKPGPECSSDFIHLVKGTTGVIGCHDLWGAHIGVSPQVGKLRHREATHLAQVHTAGPHQGKITPNQKVKSRSLHFSQMAEEPFLRLFFTAQAAVTAWGLPRECQASWTKAGGK